MTPLPISLPVYAPDRPAPLTPTDLTAYVRLGQCRRYLRLKIAQREGATFLQDFGVEAQRVSPLLSRSGAVFESDIIDEIGRAYARHRLFPQPAASSDRPTTPRCVTRSNC